MGSDRFFGFRVWEPWGVLKCPNRVLSGSTSRLRRIGWGWSTRELTYGLLSQSLVYLPHPLILSFTRSKGLKCR